MNLRAVVRGAVLGVAFVAFLTGCAGQRPLHVVQAQGDKAFAEGQYDKALADYTEFVDRRPADDKVRHKLAVTLLQVNDPTRAVEQGWLAYDQAPLNDDYIETLARAMFEAGQTDAMFKFLRDKSSDRGLVTDYLRLGRYTAGAGDADGAELAYLKAASIDGGQTIEPQLALATFYRAIGDKASEVQRLRMALFLDSTNADIAARLRELGEVPGPSLALPPTERAGAIDR